MWETQCGLEYVRSAVRKNVHVLTFTSCPVHVTSVTRLPRRLSKHVDYADPPLPVPLAVHVRPLHLPPELLHVGYADPPLAKIVPNMGVHVGYADPPTRIAQKWGNSLR